MKLRQIFIIAGLFVYTTSYSQVYEFIVCGTRGVNSVKANGEWKLLKTRETLDHFDEIRTVGPDCYLGLLHSSGRSVVIRKPGTYAAADLLKEVNSGKTAVASKYADFVFSKMTAITGVPQETGKRGIGEPSITVYLPPSGNFFSNTEVLRWSALPGKPTYKVSVRSIFDDIVAEYSTDTTLVTINFDDPKFKDQKAWFLTVEVPDLANSKSATYGLTRLTGEDYSAIEIKYNQLISELTVESPINNLIISSFFEDNKLLVDAGTYYYKFLSSSPDLKDFETMYTKFLARNGLK